VTVEGLLEGSYDEENIIPGYNDDWCQKMDLWEEAIAGFHKEQPKYARRKIRNLKTRKINLWPPVTGKLHSG
jgi:hypothetical protein